MPLPPSLNVSEEQLKKHELALLRALVEYGFALQSIKISGRYLTLGYPSFEEFIRNSKLGEDIAKFANTFFESNLNIKAFNGLIQIQKNQP